MAPSACQPWSSDTAIQSAEEHRSYTTRWDTTEAKGNDGNGMAEFLDEFRRVAARGAASTVLAIAENLPKIVDKTTMPARTSNDHHGRLFCTVSPQIPNDHGRVRFGHLRKP